MLHFSDPLSPTVFGLCFNGCKEQMLGQMQDTLWGGFIRSGQEGDWKRR